MQIIEKENYVLITPETEALDKFVDKFSKKHTTFSENNIILDFYNKKTISEKDILLFLQYAEMQQQNKKSFVVVCKSIDIDVLPDNFNVVPTLVEAEDIIEMESIQRDLGF